MPAQSWHGALHCCRTCGGWGFAKPWFRHLPRSQVPWYSQYCSRSNPFCSWARCMDGKRTLSGWTQDDGSSCKCRGQHANSSTAHRRYCAYKHGCWKSRRGVYPWYSSQWGTATFQSGTAIWTGRRSMFWTGSCRNSESNKRIVHSGYAWYPSSRRKPRWSGTHRYSGNGYPIGCKLSRRRSPNHWSNWPNCRFAWIQWTYCIYFSKTHQLGESSCLIMDLTYYLKLKEAQQERLPKHLWLMPSVSEHSNCCRMVGHWRAGESPRISSTLAYSIPVILWTISLVPTLLPLRSLLPKSSLVRPTKVFPLQQPLPKQSVEKSVIPSIARKKRLTEMVEQSLACHSKERGFSSSMMWWLQEHLPAKLSRSFVQTGGFPLVVWLHLIGKNAARKGCFRLYKNLNKRMKSQYVQLQHSQIWLIFSVGPRLKTQMMKLVKCLKRFSPTARNMACDYSRNWY